MIIDKETKIAFLVIFSAVIVVVILVAGFRYIGACLEWRARGCQRVLLLPLLHGRPGTLDWCAKGDFP